MRIRGLIFFLVIFLIAGCNNDNPLRIIKDYNQTVIYAYKTGDARDLRKVAGEREARVIGVLIDTKRNAGLVLESTLEDIKLLGVNKTADGGMIIDTIERWSYFDRPLKPGIPLGDIIKAEMKVQYECRKEDGKWKVMKVRVIENKYLNGKEVSNK